jgi:hypothetical protein
MIGRTVPPNYHVMYDYNNYSVPYIYIHKEVFLKIADDKISIFYDGKIICSHQRQYGHKGLYITEDNHMPEKHQRYGKWNKERFVSWAIVFGHSMKLLIEKVFEKSEIEQHCYKNCFALLNFAKNNNSSFVNKTAAYILDNNMPTSYNYFSKVYTIIEKQEKDFQNSEENNPYPADEGFVRGTHYFDKSEGEK